MVNWFKQQFGHHEQHQGAALGVAPEALFDAGQFRCHRVPWA